MSEAFPFTRLKDRYDLVDRVGSGSMAIVYRAQDTVLEREVAIKVLSPQRVFSDAMTERFLREARTIARLSHPHIVHLFDMGQEDRWHYLVLELLRGRTLRTHLLENNGTLPLSEAVTLTRQILMGLSYAHREGVIHRDIKPQNIMMTPHDGVRLMDFGLALTRDAPRLSEDGALVGTAYYMAPESILGETPDGRADLYAVGTLLYEMVTGQPPFSGEHVMSVVAQILHKPLMIDDRVPAALQPLLLRLLAKDPADRYADADAVLSALDALSSPAKSADEAVSSARLTDDSLLLYTAREGKYHAIEEERRQLASRLESDILTPLSLLLSQANAYQQTLADNQQVQMVASVLTGLAQNVLQKVRDLEASLHPGALEKLGLEPALEMLVNGIQRSNPIQIDLQLQRLTERLPYPMELAIYRTVQALTQYAHQQAAATRMTIQLRHDPGALRLTLQSNGDFSRAATLLTDLRNRLEQAGGHLSSQAASSEYEFEIRVDRQPVIDLTPREQEVLQHLAQGMTNKEIAALLDISPRTVNFHLDNVYSKMGVGTRMEALLVALRQGLIQSQAF